MDKHPTIETIETIETATMQINNNTTKTATNHRNINNKELNLHWVVPGNVVATPATTVIVVMKEMEETTVYRVKMECLHLLGKETVDHLY